MNPPPKFPTIEELLGLELQTKPEKHTGLLYELLGGSPLPLYNDAQTHPEKYQPDDIALLDTVISKGPAKRGSLTCGCPSEHWDLTEGDRKRLDQMVLTFATAKRIDPPPIFRRHVPKPVKEEVVMSLERLPSFWWLKK